MNADPRVASWGIRTTAPWPEDPWVFFWFETEEALRKALIEGHHATDLTSEEWQQEYKDSVQQALSQVEVITPKAVEVLEPVGLPFEIAWCGKFDELMSGSSPVAQDARRDFLEIEEFDEVPPQVGAERVDEFVAFITDWGL